MKKFNTNKDRLDNLKERGNLIKEAFQKEFNKIQRLDENEEVVKMVNYTNDILNKKGGIVRRIEDDNLKVQYKLGPLQVFQDGVSYEINTQYTNAKGEEINYSRSKYRYFDDKSDMDTLSSDIKLLQGRDMWSEEEKVFKEEESNNSHSSTFDQAGPDEENDNEYVKLVKADGPSGPYFQLHIEGEETQNEWAVYKGQEIGNGDEIFTITNPVNNKMVKIIVGTQNNDIQGRTEY